MAEENDEIRRRPNREKLTNSINLWVQESTHKKYVNLTQQGILAADHLRIVVEKELDRLLKLSKDTHD